MNFLYPGFLFLLLAVAIPILIHLFNFRKFKKVYFSNVQFLKAAKDEQASVAKLNDILILICRILVIIFLTLAFAQPYFSSGNITDPQAGNLVNIYIDNSYSMEAVNKDGSLLDEAKRRAKELAQQYALNDRFQLTTNDFEGRHQRLVNAQELISLIDEIKISPVQRNLQQVIQRQQSAEGGKRNIHTYILSDFQQAFAGKKQLLVDKDSHLSLIRIQANTVPNIVADSIWSLSPAHKPGEEEKFVVQLHNYGEEPGKDIPVKLVVNNQQRAAVRVDVPAGKTVMDTLSFSGLSAGWQQAVVTIKDYPIVFDDELKFTFKVGTGLNILQISGDSEEKYISSLFKADGYFKLTVMQESNIAYSSLSSYDMIVLSGLKTPSTGLAEQLKNYVQNGGSAVLFPDLDTDISSFSSFLQGLSLPPITSLSKDTVNVSAIDLKSNLFNDVFEHVPSKIDLPKIYRYFNYVKRNASTREDIMELPAGQPFFSRYQLGAGGVYLSATSLSGKDSNLPQHPIFVPLLYKIAFNSVQQQPLYYTIGRNNLLSSSQLAITPGESLRLIAENQEIIPEVQQVPGKTLLYIADQVRTAGFYELLKAKTLISTYAFNENRAESDMHYASDQELEQLASKNIKVLNSLITAASAAVENNHTELWKLCLVLCAVFLAVEALLIRFFNKPKI
jgi:hypothetical protein